MNMKVIWKRKESRGSGWCEHDEIAEDEVTVIGYVFDSRRNEVVAICEGAGSYIYTSGKLYCPLKTISLSELFTRKGV